MLFKVPGYLPTEQLFTNTWPSFILLVVLISATEIPLLGKTGSLNPLDSWSLGKPQV